MTALLIIVAVAVFVWVTILWGAMFSKAWNTGSTETASIEESELAELAAQKRLALSNIKELDLDYETGKLSERDYKRLRADASSEALVVMKALEAVEGQLRYGKQIAADLDNLAVGRVAPSHVRPAAPARDDSATALAALRRELAQEGAQCPACQHRMGLADKFCPECGHRVGAREEVPA